MSRATLVNLDCFTPLLPTSRRWLSAPTTLHARLDRHLRSLDLTLLPARIAPRPQNLTGSPAAP